MLVLMVRLGVWFIPPRVSVQGGVVSGDFDPGSPVRASYPTAAQLPPTEAASIPDPPAMPLPLELADGSIPPPVARAELLLSAAAADPVIGVSYNFLNDARSIQFPVELPPTVRQRIAAGSGGVQYASAAAAAAPSSGDIGPTGNGGTGNGTGSGDPAGVAGGGPVPDHGNRPPRYPAEAKRKRWEGTVWLAVDVTEQGTVADIAVEKSSGFDVLDREALNAVRDWKFTPAQEAGRPVRSHGRFPVEFHLRG